MQILNHPILIYLICYCSFLIAEKASAQTNSHKLRAILFKNGSMDIWQLKTIYGLLVLGSCIIYYRTVGTIDLFASLFLQSANNMMTWGKMAIYIAVAIFLVTKRNLQDYHQQAGSIVKNLFPYFALQIPFLIVYELFFRGVILFAITVAAGPVAAILVTTCLSVFIQSHENRKKIAGSALISFMLCIICLDIQSALPAVLIRLVAALILELRLFRFSQLLNLNK
jgi:hypothetical protein